MWTVKDLLEKLLENALHVYKTLLICDSDVSGVVNFDVPGEFSIQNARDEFCWWFFKRVSMRTFP